ncbi:2-carboxy-1,4-naphthoquinone phytyltransferase [Synechococcus sp. CS-602]|uniref:2-carboxy-1,4-naphthoquinone phytyltransferase n=1 Tax=Synechococcaceae TaxID=1890426 RepID=UPI0008FF0A38|nr:MULTISPECIES: 2-carboxy-1,4-naphthoquinone phytyltransferase [Synechococcaceae]MCT4363764.1 2-carboxy-1,4-naphthoquinone phytyltransferase [Candidatus Regnicoccus frigidus MAG-AL1]APD47961.1 1,4-dihydroxy-2-naphthoate phytyltransferase [Synechococcus sp. SynAce01]MCT0201045.1 2-carboxy-1,4-naphthoquinone phytyltransferase [Synechococcus sp. CS-603]MCT0204518.1 2-carboxy-1,4-naphthoquinone phytyltransferase [Synechococcus sp. CS-602]MCT0245421.1 2-carboxy-1,4-naphthoquinone phytyltransferase
MSGPQVVASRYAAAGGRRQLWKAAIKWPMYSVAVMPALLAAGWWLAQGQPPRWGQLLGFLLAAVLLLAWENLANDVFDADTGVDRQGKPHSVVNLTGRRDRVALLANGCLLLGLGLIALVAARSSPAVLVLVLACCGIGYAYQGPPLRLSYRGLGEPLCWLAFGPLATAAALLALAPVTGEASPFSGLVVPWRSAIALGGGPAIATSLVLYCSHFHQVDEDAAHGKRSPVVRLGTAAAAGLVPWFIALTLALQWAPVLAGRWPLTALLGVIGLPPGLRLIQLLGDHHASPERISGSKFLALKFQAFNGLGLACGLAVGPWLGAVNTSWFQGR